MSVQAFIGFASQFASICKLRDNPLTARVPITFDSNNRFAHAALEGMNVADP
jgi:hypothetical protein